MSSSSKGKPIPLPPAPARAARRYSIPALALVHLLLLLVARSGGGWAWWAGPWAGSAFSVAGALLFRDLLTARRIDRLPDVLAAFAWASAGGLEMHALSDGLAETRIVTAALFPAAAYLFPPLSAAAVAVPAAGWLACFSSGGRTLAEGAVSTAPLALLGLAAGYAARRRIDRAVSGTELVRKAIDESRSLVLPWENTGAAAADDPLGPIAELGPLRWREEMGKGVKRVLEGILPMSGADIVLFASPSPEPGRPFRVEFSAGDEGRGSVAPTIPDSYVPVREALIFRRAYHAEGEEAGRWPPGNPEERGRPSGVAAVPVPDGDGVAGALVAVRYGEGGWTEPVVQLMEMGAFFVERELAAGRRWYAAALRMAREDGFHRFVGRIAEAAERGGGEESGGVSPREEIYRETAGQVRGYLGVDRVLLVEADPRGSTGPGGPKGRIAFEASGDVREGCSGGEGEEAWTTLDGTYAGWVLKNDVHRIFTSVRTSGGRHPVIPARWSDPREDEYLLVPVRGAGDFSGVLVCASRVQRNFKGEDADAVREIIRFMRMGITHARRMEGLERKAESDGLTGLLNQRTFRERLSNVLGRLDGRYPCAVVMLDLDHFKRVNDTHGHPAGDEVLRKTASVIRKTIRKVDFAGRYGGEEFVIYLGQTDKEHARQVSERLRLTIRKTKFVFDGKEVSVTASMGLACHPGDGRTADEILKRADVALYRSKQDGRDRVTVS